MCLEFRLVDLHLKINSSKYPGGIKSAHCCQFNVDGRHVSAHVHTCCDTYLAKSLITPVIYPVFLLYNTPLSVNSV